jgi:hypothetical protein
MPHIAVEKVPEDRNALRSPMNENSLIDRARGRAFELFQVGNDTDGLATASGGAAA